jgi:hypothetical protein
MLPGIASAALRSAGWFSKLGESVPLESLRVETRRRELEQDEAMMIAITIEAEPLGDSAAIFRLFVNGAAVANGLTLVEPQLVVCKSLQRIALQRAPLDAPAPVPKEDRPGAARVGLPRTTPIPPLAGAA